MNKTILITGAGSGFGEGAALALAGRGHKVIAGTQIAAQKTALLKKARDAGIDMQIEVLDITRDSDRRAAFDYEIDVLLNNAGTTEVGPVAEIPMDRVRDCFETNVFGTLAMIQGVAPQMVKRGSGKIVIVTSINGLFTVPFAAIYASTKHALEALAEGLKDELAGTGVDVCTVNPGPFATGFNDRAGETMARWFDIEASLSPASLVAETMGGLQKAMQNQLDPQIMTDALVRIVEEETSRFRNVIPDAMEPWLKSMEASAWEAGTGKPLWGGFPE